MQYNIIKAILSPFIAAVMAVMPMSNAVAAGAIWVGVNGNADTSLLYYFARGYADIITASNAARDACNGEHSVCINEIPVGNGGLTDRQAYVVYSNFVHGDDYRGGTGLAATLASAREAALMSCNNNDGSVCREELAVQDSGNSNPQIIRIPVQYTVPASSGGGGGGGSSAGAVIGGIAVVGLGVWLYNNTTPDLPDAESSFLPVAEYAENDGVRDWSVGGRYDWRKGRMVAYYEAKNSADGFSYGSRLEYDGGFWKAAFTESVQGETADYDFALLADFGGGIWKFSPNYRMHSEFANGEFDTTNSLNLSGELRYDDWTIRPSTGFRWENADEFGENARFGFSAVRKF